MAGVQACQNFQVERYAMKNSTDIIALSQPEIVDDPLTEIAPDGAWRMLAAALRARADVFVAQHAEETLPDGRQRVVRHGFGPDAASRPGSARSMCNARRCATAPPICRPKRRSVSPLASCQNGCGAHAASMLCCPGSICAASRWATSKRHWPRSWGKMCRTCRPVWSRALQENWQQEYDRWHRRDLSARR